LAIFVISESKLCNTGFLALGKLKKKYFENRPSFFGAGTKIIMRGLRRELVLSVRMGVIIRIGRWLIRSLW
jgi:hypothetical protein